MHSTDNDTTAKDTCALQSDLGPHCGSPGPGNLHQPPPPHTPLIGTASNVRKSAAVREYVNGIHNIKVHGFTNEMQQ